MKKIIALIAMLSVAFLASCSKEEVVVDAPVAEVTEGTDAVEATESMVIEGTETVIEGTDAVEATESMVDEATEMTEKVMEEAADAVEPTEKMVK